MRFIFVSFLLFTFSGCVGIGTVVSDERTYGSSNLTEIQGIFGIDSKKIYTKKEVVSIWGEPKNIYKEGNCEYWVYNRELAWGGITIWAIVPIPLFIPIGSRVTTLIFDSKTTVGAIYEYGRLPSALCSPLIPFVHSGNNFCAIIDF